MDTLPDFLREVAGQAILIHVDCDLYESTANALKILSPRIKNGTIIVFDEYFNYSGWKDHEYRAFAEFLSATGLECEYLAFNARGQQVAVKIIQQAIA